MRINILYNFVRRKCSQTSKLNLFAEIRRIFVLSLSLTNNLRDHLLLIIEFIAPWEEDDRHLGHQFFQHQLQQSHLLPL